MANSLGDRMKENYENRYQISLTRRTPVIIRLDGKAFHTFTKDFDKPYDRIFKEAMWQTAVNLCSYIQNSKFAFVQSDEISILLTDYDKLTTEAFFDYNIQKMVSVSAAYASARFTSNLEASVLLSDSDSHSDKESLKKKYLSYKSEPIFDSRVFNIPTSEVCNYFIWRQQDATKNSISMLGRCHFSQKQLQGLHSKEIQDLLISHNINWNDQPTFFKRGVGIQKERYLINEGSQDEVLRSHWIINTHIPIFSQDREFINQYLATEDDT